MAGSTADTPYGKLSMFLWASVQCIHEGFQKNKAILFGTYKDLHIIVGVYWCPPS